MYSKVHLENVWTSKQMITEGDAAIPLETTRRAFRNQEQSKQRSAIDKLSYVVKLPTNREGQKFSKSCQRSL